MNKFFYIVDVFAEKKYAGNQLAVVRGDYFFNEEMQHIAKEMNYSETTFIVSGEVKNGGYDVRIFTPEEEVPFAGHPSLGTAYIIQKKLIKSPVKEIKLNLKCGQIPVACYSEGDGTETLWMTQLPPVFGQSLEANKISEVLGLGEAQIDERYPVQEVSTGLPFIIVPAKTLDAVKSINLNRGKYMELINDTNAKCILVFCPETYNQENDINARVFCDYYGVPEDPATGSANGCLAGYLAKYRYFGKESISVKVEQGYEINRHSLLLLKAVDTGDKIDINVGGRVFMVAEGTLV